jgi:CMP-N-acetylneuraminic acid synthetase
VKTLAFIPARSGSRRLPGKNLRKVDDVSLVSHAVGSAIWCTEIVVSSDDEAILAEARDGYQWCNTTARFKEHRRPADLATDTARVDDAIAHYLASGVEQPDVIVLLQPTSPLRTATHVREALQVMRDTDADTVVSVCRSHTHRFAGRLRPQSVGRVHQWSDGDEVSLRAMAWEPSVRSAARPRTQDVSALAHENGAIYAVTREHFERTGSLHGGDAFAYVMDRWSSIDVDDEDDLALAEWAERRRGG